MALSTFSELLTWLNNPIRIAIDKLYNNAGHQNFGWSSYWTIAGTFWPAGAVPPTGAGSALSSSDTGAMPFPGVPGGDKMYLIGMALSQANGSSIQDMAMVLYDRLVHTSGLNANITSLQAVATTALTRHTSGLGVQMYAEIYTAVGASATTVTVEYTNDSGVAKTTSFSIGSSTNNAALQMLRIPLASGDLGVRSVESVTLAGGTGTAGNFGITLAYPIAMFPLLADNAAIMPDWMDLGLPEIDPAACVALFGHQAGNHSGLNGNLSFAVT